MSTLKLSWKKTKLSINGMELRWQQYFPSLRIHIASVLFNDYINKHSVNHSFSYEKLNVYELYRGRTYSFLRCLSVIVLLSLLIFEKSPYIAFDPDSFAYIVNSS